MSPEGFEHGIANLLRHFVPPPLLITQNSRRPFWPQSVPRLFLPARRAERFTGGLPGQGGEIFGGAAPRELWVSWLPATEASLDPFGV